MHCSKIGAFCYRDDHPLRAAKHASGASMGSGNQSEQQVPIAPDPGTDDAGHITEVGKHLIRFGRFETELDFPWDRYEAFLECRRASTLIEIDEPKCDCCSDQSHHRTRSAKPIAPRLSGKIIRKCCEQPGGCDQETESNNGAIEPCI